MRAGCREIAITRVLMHAVMHIQYNSTYNKDERK